MTTPYGTTTFRQGVDGGGLSRSSRRRIRSVARSGSPTTTMTSTSTSRSSSRRRRPMTPSRPGRVRSRNHDLNIGQTHYWDKRTMALYGADYRRAKAIRWTTDLEPGERQPPPSSRARSNPSRTVSGTHTLASLAVRYSYERYRGPLALPTRVGRVLDDGTSQVYAYEYNSLGGKIRETDPFGRTTIYTYAPNEIDLLEVRRIRGQEMDLVASYTYNDNHQALTATDAAGQTTTYTYTASGQIETVTPRDGLRWPSARRRTSLPLTTRRTGRLQTVTGPARRGGDDHDLRVRRVRAALDGRPTRTATPSPRSTMRSIGRRGRPTRTGPTRRRSTTGWTPAASGPAGAVDPHLLRRAAAAGGDEGRGGPDRRSRSTVATASGRRHEMSWWTRTGTRRGGSTTSRGGTKEIRANGADVHSTPTRRRRAG